MKKTELYEFLDSWNQLDKAEDGYKPINPYQLHALVLAPAFYLKWYLSAEEFSALAKEQEYEFEPPYPCNQHKCRINTKGPGPMHVTIAI